MGAGMGMRATPGISQGRPVCPVPDLRVAGRATAGSPPAKGGAAPCATDVRLLLC